MRRSAQRILAAMLAIGLITGAAAPASALFGLGHHKDGKHKKGTTPIHGKRIPILISEKGALPDPTLANVPVVVPEIGQNQDWPQPGGSPSKANDPLALGATLKPVWTKRIVGNTYNERLADAPVVVAGKLYIMDVHAKVTAFDIKTGNQLWVADFGAFEGKFVVYGGGVSVDGDMVFATNGMGDVGALSAATGKLIWKKRPAGPLRGAPSSGGNGDIYITTQDNQLIAVKAVDGTVDWSASASLESAGVFGTAAPAIGQGSVVEGFSSGELNAYRYENGRALWGDVLAKTSISTSVGALTDIDADPVISQGKVYAIGAGGRMVSVDLLSGQRQWELNISGLSTPWVAGEWIFVLTDDANLHCIARGTGKIRWTLKLPKTVKNKPDGEPLRYFGPILAGGRLLFTSSDGLIGEVNPATGDLTKWTHMYGANSLPPVVADNMLFTLDNLGRLTAWK